MLGDIWGATDDTDRPCNWAATPDEEPIKDFGYKVTINNFLSGIRKEVMQNGWSKKGQEELINIAYDTIGMKDFELERIAGWDWGEIPEKRLIALAKYAEIEMKGWS